MPMPVPAAVEVERLQSGQRFMTNSRAVRLGFIAAVLLLTAGIAASALLLLAPDRARVDLLRAEIERATGLHVLLRGPLEVRVLPRPMIVAHDVAITASDGAVAVQVGTARGMLALSALFRGRTALASLSLANVTGSIDADALAQQMNGADSGSVSAVSTRPDPPFGPSTVALMGGLVQIRSSRAALAGFLGDINAALDGLRGGAGAFSGHASWHGERADISGRLDSLLNFLRGEQASGSLHVRSRAVTASFSGTWLGGWRGKFNGTVTAATPSLPSLLRLAGIEPGAFVGIERASFNGSADGGPTGLAFDSAHVSINDDALEGTLGLQNQDGRWMLAGTLATDKLDVAPFAAVMPVLRENGSWSEAPIPLAPRDLHDLDLRLSVGRLQLGRLHADDVALSFLCRDGRMELSVGEARAYGGLIKARLFAAGQASDLTLKGDASWSQLDVKGISRALSDNAAGTWSGMTSGSITAEGTGGSARAIIARLEGKGQASWHQGRIGVWPAIGLLLRPIPSPGFVLAARLRSRHGCIQRCRRHRNGGDGVHQRPGWFHRPQRPSLAGAPDLQLVRLLEDVERGGARQRYSLDAGAWRQGELERTSASLPPDRAAPGCPAGRRDRQPGLAP